MSFREINDFEKELGRYALDNMHIHMAGIAYSEKGERNHLILKDSDFNYKDLIKYAEEHINEPECYSFLRYAYPEIEYPKRIGNSWIFSGKFEDGEINKPISSILSILRKMIKAGVN